MKHIKKHWILYLYAVFCLFFSLMFPTLEIKVQGGFAWLFFLGGIFLGLIMIYTGFFGGEVTYESEGLIPMIKRIRKEKEISDKVWFEWLIGKRKIK